MSNKKEKVQYPIFKTKCKTYIEEILVKEDHYTSAYPIAFFVLDPTDNCSLCTLASVQDLLEDDGALEFALKNSPNRMVLMDINEDNRAYVLNVCKKAKYPILLNKEYKSVTGSEMVILIVQVQ